MMIRKNIVCVGVVAVLLVAGSTSSSKNIAADWIFKIENMTSFALSPNGAYVIVACEEGPRCEKGQFYVFDRYGNTVTHNCINSEITVVDIADNGAFFIGTRTGYYFSSTSGKVQQDIKMESMFRSVSMSEDGETVVAGTDEEILIFNRNGIIDEKVVNRPVKFTGIDSSGKRAVAGTEDKIFVYERLSKKWLEKLVKVGGIGDLAISDDGSTIICGMPTRIVWILDSRLNMIKELMIKDGIKSVAVTASGKFFVCSTIQGKVYYLDSSGDEKWSEDLKRNIKNIFVSSDGGLVAVLCESIRLFDSLGHEIRELKSSRNIEGVQLSESGGILSYNSVEELAFVELFQEAHVPTCEYEFPSRKSIPLDDQLTCVWSYGEFPQSIFVADINGDGENEVICSFNREIAVLDSEGNMLWSKPFDFQPGITLMDLDQDLIPEVVVRSKDNRMQIQVFNGEGIELAEHEFHTEWYTQPPSQEFTIGIHPIWSGDIDDDSSIEVVCKVNAGYILKPRGFYTFEYDSFQKEWYYKVAPDLSTIHIIDIDGDGQAEIVAGSYAVCNGREILDTDDCHSYVYAVTLKGETLWRTEIGSYGSRVDIAVVDLDSDGKQEIVGAGWSYEDDWGKLFVLNSKGNYVFGEERKLRYSVFLEGIADLDNDGDLEILTSTFPSTLVLYDHEMKVIRRQDVSMKLGFSGQVMVNDIDADGKKEIILTSDDKKLLILDENLREEWAESFSESTRGIRTVVTNLQGCKNHLLVLADKLYAFTYSKSLEWPCIPWIIAKQQKEVEAEESLEKGEECLEEENCECAKNEFTKAKVAYEQIRNQDGINLAEGRINTANTCLSAQKSLEKAKEFFKEENRSMAEKHLSEAEEAYEIIENPERLEEIQQYFEQIKEIKHAERYFDDGRNLIGIGSIVEGVSSLEEARKIYRRYGWVYHVQLVEDKINEASMPRFSPLEFSIISFAVALAIGLLAIFFQFFGITYQKIKQSIKKGPPKEKTAEEDIREEVSRAAKEDSISEKEQVKEDKDIPVR